MFGLGGGGSKPKTQKRKIKIYAVGTPENPGYPGLGGSSLVVDETPIQTGGGEKKGGGGMLSSLGSMAGSALGFAVAGPPGAAVGGALGGAGGASLEGGDVGMAALTGGISGAMGGYGGGASKGLGGIGTSGSASGFSTAANLAQGGGQGPLMSGTMAPVTNPTITPPVAEPSASMAFKAPPIDTYGGMGAVATPNDMHVLGNSGGYMNGVRNRWNQLGGGMNPFAGWSSYY